MAETRVFSISVDTEADLLDKSRNTLDSITGIHYLQELCEDTDIVPAYLITYEVATRDEAISVIKPYLDAGKCEIGHHLHVWSNPPFENENDFGVDESWISGYQSELDKDTLFKKMDILHEAIKTNYGVTPKIHRAGRWAVNQDTFEWLEKNSYTIDSSIAPLISFTEQKGKSNSFPYDGRKVSPQPYRPSKNNFLEEDSNVNSNYNLWEIPLSTFSGDFFARCNIRGQSFLRRYAWKLGLNLCPALPLRPSFDIPDQVFEYGINSLFESDNSFFLGMLHSNELGLGGSPKSRNKTLLEGIKKRLSFIIKKSSEYNIKGCAFSQLPDFISEK
ncbi:MAG: polysaccharide deacetylase family protein [Planctomycetota bacterium]|jgi:hypothetical protein